MKIPSPQSNSFFRKHRFRKSGFTLVEVAMSLGIFAFAIVPLLGLMGTGLSVHRESMETSLRSRILSQVAPLARASANATGSALFTADGQLTQDSGESAYTVRWSAQQASSLGEVIEGLRANQVWTVTMEKPGVGLPVAAGFVTHTTEPAAR